MATPVFGSGYIPAAGAVTNELNAITRRAFVPKLVVQLYQAAPLLSLMMRNSQRARGGLNAVTVPIQGNSFVSFGWTDYSGTFNQPTNATAIQSAAWNLSVGVVPVQVLGMESMTQATEAVIPLVKARMADTRTVMVQSFSNALFGSNAANVQAINGFQDIYDDGTTVNSYGGIPRSANAFWKAGKYTSALAVSRSTMLAQINATQQNAGGEAPDMVIMSLSDWTALVQDYMSAEQFNTNPTSKYGKDDAVNAGFRAIMLGNTPILADPFCPKGTAYLINTKYLALYISEYANFAFTGFESLVAQYQLGSVGAVVTAMAAVCTKPATGRQITNITNGAF